MLDEGLVHILATDSHHIDRRPPLLAEGREAAAKRVGEAESWHLVRTRPQGIIDNAPVDSLPPLPERQANAARPLWKRLFGNA
jgi:protein-tyrosine phosphatase